MLVDDLTDHPLRPDDDALGWLRAHAELRRGDPAAAAAWLRGDHGMLPEGLGDRPPAG